MPPGEPPHPKALFSLVPLNARAKSILTYRDNVRFVSSFPLHKANPTVKVQGLDIGPQIASGSNETLAILGRVGNIKFDDLEISPYHCSFELDQHNREEVILQDRSLDNSTQPYGQTAKPFKQGHPHRRVLVDREINLQFGMGGPDHNLYQFQIYWHDQRDDNRVGNPHHARTIADEPPTSGPSPLYTGIHAAGIWGMIRYSKRKKLGKGAFGEVWKVADVDTGKHLAVKRLKMSHNHFDEYSSLKQEARMLSSVSHVRTPSEFSPVKHDGYFDIFMELKPGSVQDLIDEYDLFERDTNAAISLAFQMLKALDYLAQRGMIHRDVKPLNILFTPLSNGKYLYQLADFGLANTVVNAQTYAGTKMYMAPELYQDSPWLQTVKMDIWSLFVTLAYAMNAAGFQNKPMSPREQVFKAVSEATSCSVLGRFREMAIMDPCYRATAEDMLDTARSLSEITFTGFAQGPNRM
ncbi:Protein kinase domain-containing protein [Fusarium sp. LHS14.1]|nr:Protein kinase domain-containing protein [Fusarium sp. LHS14.1]